MLKITFLAISILLVLLLLVYKLHICKLKRTSRTSLYISVIAGVLLLYILCGMIFPLFVSGALNKMVIFLFAISPFIIGKFATYEKEKIFSYIQILTVAFSAFYVLIVV